MGSGINQTTQETFSGLKLVRFLQLNCREPFVEFFTATIRNRNTRPHTCMAGKEIIFGTNQNRVRPTELSDRRCNVGDLLAAVRARVVGRAATFGESWNQF